MSSGCGDVLSLEDLKTAKKHQTFEAEVITGKAGGVSSGADIDYATNQVTGQTQKTLPAVLRDAGFRPASFTFTTGGTLTVNDADLAVLWPIADGGDGNYYAWKGSLPKTIPAASTPSSTGGVGSSAWDSTDVLAKQAYELASDALNNSLRSGAIVSGIQESIAASNSGQVVLTLNGDETVTSLENDYGVEIDARRGRVFDTSGVQLTTYSNPRDRFVTGEEYLNYVINKMINADGISLSQKVYVWWSGDSTVVGVNAGVWNPAAVGNFYARRYGIKDIKHDTLGHSGKSLYEWGYFYINDENEWAQQASADLLILRWGINDPMLGYSLEQCRSALDRGLSKLRANKTVAQQSIIIMTPNATADTPNGRDEKWYEQLTAMMRSAAKKYQCMFFDTYGLFQDARSGAGKWLDDPYGDGRGIHPNATMSAQIYDKLFEVIYGPVRVINGSSNLFSNNGSSLQFINSSYPPNTFDLGVSWWRGNPADSSWPVDCEIQVERFVDGLVVQKISGYSNENTRVTFSRMGRISENTWSTWRGYQYPISSLLLNSWTVGSSRSATYQKSIDGIVTVSAVLTGGVTTSGTTVLTLPSGFRPKYDISYIPCGTNSAVGLINILANGNVNIQLYPSGSILTLNFSFPALIV